VLVAAPAGQAPAPGRARAPPQRDTSQAAVGTGIIAGRVVLDGSGTPVRRARVTLAAPELRGGRTAVTDDEGRFAFHALPPGRYTITASKAGFVSMAYGARRPSRPGTPVQLADGQTLDRLTIPLPRGSVITGVVVDEHGDPVPGTQVRAMRFVMQTGERTLQMAGQDQTDDRGVYRIFQLVPGEYIVSAVPRNVNVVDARQAIVMEIASLAQAQPGGPALTAAPAVQARVAELQRQLQSFEEPPAASYAPVFYPGGTSPAAAEPIALGPGEERGGVNLRLRLVPTTTVSGVVVTPSGMAPQGTTVALVPKAAGMPAIPGLGSNVSRV